MTTIDYSSGPRITNVGDHVVYTKATWAASWTAQPNLVCTECAWNAAPDFNTALLVWRTGYLIMPGDTSPTLFGPWTGRGHFVRIDWACEDSTTLRWVGFIDQSGWPTEAFGDQPLVCYGLEKALALTPIMDHAFKRGSTIYRSAVPPRFGHFSRTKTADGGGVYVFNDPMREDITDWEGWSTRTIIAYLLKYNVPTGNSGVGTIPWSISQGTLLPDWDAPVVDTLGRTVWDVLNELVGPDKQLGFTVGSDGSTAYLRVFTHTSSTITVGSQSLSANPNQHTLILSPDALTNASLSDVGGGYDQVICRGAKRQTICTLAHTTHIEDVWDSSAETSYEAGASAETAYAAANTQEQRQMNARVRSRYDQVYRDFRIKRTFNWQVSSEDLFPGNSNPREVNIVNQLPIKPDVDWSGTVDTADYDRNAGRPWSLWFANPDSLLKYVDASKISTISSEAVTTGGSPAVIVSAEVAAALQGISIKVQGAPQHAIAGTNFTRLPVDSPAGAFGGLDYSTMKLTLALEEDRYCEGKYPASNPTSDIVRRLVVTCGSDYRQVRIHKDTIAIIDHQGTDKKVTTSAYLVDDSAKLQALAQVIALGLVLTRKRVNWTSQRRISTIAVGDMINTAEGATVLAPVTAIRINAPMSVNAPARCPTQSFDTFGGTHDPLAVLRRLGMVV